MLISHFFLIIATIIIHCSAHPLSPTQGVRQAVSTPVPIVLSEKGLEAYAERQGGTIGFYGSCKGEPAGSCRYPLECMQSDTDDNKDQLFVTQNGTCEATSSTCMCHMATTRGYRCKRSSNCDKDYRCASFLSQENNYCVSCTIERDQIPHITGFTDNASVKCKKFQEADTDRLGFNFDVCENDSDCADKSLCAEYPVFATEPYKYCVGNDTMTSCGVYEAMALFQRCKGTSDSGLPCVCRHPPNDSILYGCGSSLECPSGERCMLTKEDGRVDGLCMSCDPPALPIFELFEPADDGMGKCGDGPIEPTPDPIEPTPQPIEPTPEPIEPTPIVYPQPSPTPAPCVAVHALTEFQPHQLVFENHIRASVLCDEHNNCATPGHIVVFKNQAMMMGTYCSKIDGGCKKRVMDVNSPRIARGLRVQSFSTDLQYTAFSARYESVAEEYILSMIIRAGI